MSLCKRYESAIRYARQVVAEIKVGPYVRLACKRLTISARELTRRLETKEDGKRTHRSAR
jgi:hypothetical protein